MSDYGWTYGLEDAALRAHHAFLEAMERMMDQPDALFAWQVDHCRVGIQRDEANEPTAELFVSEPASWSAKAVYPIKASTDDWALAALIASLTIDPVE